MHDGRILVGFAGATADAFALVARLEAKLEQFQGNLNRAAVELAQEWRTDRALRHLEAFLLATDGKATYLLSGGGDVIEPDDGLLAVGSGGTYALAAARALLRHTKMTARQIALESMKIASEICIFTNGEIVVEEL
jgi:ATP-dependent HslUV protease subunit HslV